MNGGIKNMNTTAIDLKGQKFGRLLVIERKGSNERKRALWLCKCDCGNEKIVIGDLLRNGHVKSCGCLLKEYRQEKMTKHGYGKHNEVDRLYRVWKGMKSRCYSKNAKSYKWYGARGIKVCDEWHDYNNFREWAYKNGYDENAKIGECTIDRIDSDGDYCPENCRWVGMDIQLKNKHKKGTFSRLVECTI